MSDHRAWGTPIKTQFRNQTNASLDGSDCELATPKERSAKEGYDALGPDACAMYCSSKTSCGSPHLAGVVLGDGEVEVLLAKSYIEIKEQLPLKGWIHMLALLGNVLDV